MPFRPALAAFAVLPFLCLAISSPPAIADDDGDDPVTCTIVDTSPDAIVLGVTPKNVTFDVGTDCDDDYPVDWIMQSELIPHSPGISWLNVCNYARPTDHISCGPAPRARIDVVHGTLQGNEAAGAHVLNVYAFYDANGNNEPDADEPLSTMQSSVQLKRATTWGSTFNASPEPRRKGQKMNINGSIKYANWDTGQYQKFGTYVMLQFRPAGQDDYQDVKLVWDNGVDAKTTVKVTRTGTWRYHFDGDDTHGPSNSKGDTVKVNAARR